jgi:hypothetical protein
VEGGGVVGAAIGGGEVHGHQETNLHPAPDVLQEAGPGLDGGFILRQHGHRGVDKGDPLGF